MIKAKCIAPSAVNTLNGLFLHYIFMADLYPGELMYHFADTYFLHVGKNQYKYSS